MFYGQYACDRPKPIDNNFLIRNDRVDFLLIIHSSFIIDGTINFCLLLFNVRMFKDSYSMFCIIPRMNPLIGRARGHCENSVGTEKKCATTYGAVQ